MYSHTPEARRKMSEAQKGNTHTLGNKLSEEHKGKISQSMKEYLKVRAPWNKGGKLSAETRRNMCEAQRKRRQRERFK